MSNNTPAVPSRVSPLDPFLDTLDPSDDFTKRLILADREALAIVVRYGALQHGEEVDDVIYGVADAFDHATLNEQWDALLDKAVPDYETRSQLSGDHTKLETIVVDAAYALGLCVGLRLAGVR